MKTVISEEVDAKIIEEFTTMHNSSGRICWAFCVYHEKCLDILNLRYEQMDNTGYSIEVWQMVGDDIELDEVISLFLYYFKFIKNKTPHLKDTWFITFKEWLQVNKNKYVKVKKPREKSMEEILTDAYNNFN